MKKIFIIVVLALIVVQGIAQDVPVFTFRDLSYYQDKPWIEDCEDTAGSWYNAGSTVPYGLTHSTCSQLYETDTVLTIYGMAAILVNYFPFDSVIISSQRISFSDTCLEHTFDTLYMHYFDTAGEMQILKSVRCAYVDPVVSHLYFPYNYDDGYYVFYRSGDLSMISGEQMFGLWNPDDYRIHEFDIREVYFDSAICIADSFYVAAQNHNMLHTINRRIVPNRTFMMMLFSTPCMPSSVFVRSRTTNDNTLSYTAERRGIAPAMLGIFPILTPPPAVDTTGQGGDSTAVDMVDGVGRYVSLTPNPASDKVQVLSSFGLKQVEAYNAEGRLVYADEAHGLSKTIDLAAWPRGIYLVRIVTPMGSTTKKLVLR